jgi:hypothetical protein
MQAMCEAGEGNAVLTDETNTFVTREQASAYAEEVAARFSAAAECATTEINSFLRLLAMTPDYSFSTLTDDGPLTQKPRWMHWLLKVLIGYALAAPFLYLLHWSPAVAFLPGLVFILFMKQVLILWDGVLPYHVEFIVPPSQWRPHDWWTADAATDSALHVAGGSLLLALSTTTFGYGIIAGVGLSAVFWLCYPWARP